MNAPIVFCHFNNSPYLPFVLESARLTNPDKEIFLLGDEKNRWMGKAKDVTHLNYLDFDSGPLIEQFDRVYRTVQGPHHRHIKGGQDWLKFVFKRWFFVNRFLHSRQINSFWHFDSDTMLLVPLGEHEAKFQAFDCTEQCNGMCLNGFVPDASFLTRYLNKINALFQDEAFLDEQQRSLDQERRDEAFTEMSAYRFFKEQETVRSIHLAKPIEGNMFDDCICQPHNMQTETLFNGKEIKKIHCSPTGEFFGVDTETLKPVRFNSLNLSWVPQQLFHVVLRQRQKSKSDIAPASLSESVEHFPTLAQLLWRYHFLASTIGTIKARTRSLRKGFASFFLRR